MFLQNVSIPFQIIKKAVASLVDVCGTGYATNLASAARCFTNNNRHGVDKCAAGVWTEWTVLLLLIVLYMKRTFSHSVCSMQGLKPKEIPRLKMMFSGEGLIDPYKSVTLTVYKMEPNEP